MSIKSKRIIKRIFATFLILSLTLCYFTISVSASQRYVHVNDTVYSSADAYGWEELPYGTDTGVVQFQYGSNYLTLYFDKLSIYDDYGVLDRGNSMLSDYYWNAQYVVNDNGSFDYKVNIISDSPIYYKAQYDSGGVFSSTVGVLSTKNVMYYDQTVDGTNTITTKSFAVYELNDFLLSYIVPEGWSLGSSVTSYGSRRIYSNVYMCQTIMLDDEFGERTLYYYPVRAAGPTNFVNGSNVGYNVEYYPTLEYLQNYDIRAQIVTAWKEVVELQDITKDVLNELYTVNVYLETIKNYLNSIDNTTLGIHSLLDIYLPLLNYNLGEILTVLEEILQGPEYDSSQGVGSNTEFGDAAGGLMQGSAVPDSGVGDIENSLGGSFILIRGIFDSIVSDWFPLNHIIVFLLGLSFIAYVLGRVIKNKMR